MTKPHIKRMLFKPRGYPHSEWMWSCSGFDLVAVGNTPRHAYLVWQAERCEVVARRTFFDTSFMLLAGVC